MIVSNSNDPSGVFMSPPPATTATGSTTTEKQQSNGGSTDSNSNNDSPSITDTSTTNSKATVSSITTTPTSRHSKQSLLSHSLHDNMLEKHHKIDPMEFYTIEAVLGEGSMVRFLFVITA